MSDLRKTLLEMGIDPDKVPADGQWLTLPSEMNLAHLPSIAAHRALLAQLRDVLQKELRENQELLDRAREDLIRARRGSGGE